MLKLNGLLFLCSLSAIITSAILTATPSTYCEVPERKLSFVYNLTKLSSDKEDIIIEHDHETIRMQLCSPLIKKCNNQEGYAICLIKNNTEIGIGRFPPKLDNEQGRILFNFTGDKCLETNYTVTIIMHCDYDTEINSNPELFSHGDQQCDLYIVWKTALACVPRIQTNCTVANAGHYYDLSPLTRASENYVIPIDVTKSSKIILNVCQSIIHHSTMCPIKSGACLDDPERPNRYLSLGEVQKPPSFINGRLQIEYQDGALCTRNITTPHVKTTITFVCSLEAKGPPEYILGTGREDCHYQLIWYTAAACDVETLRDYSAKRAGKCNITNPITNFIYDLQTLMNKDFTVTNASGIKYKFRVCSALNTCGNKTGICNSKYDTSLGQANTNLMWQQGGPYLNYTNGDLCENGMRHYTLIRFFCEPQGSYNQPSLMKESTCQTIIHWNTDLVCEKKIKCDNNDEINLTPLMQSKNNYIIKANDTEFHINICRPLVPTQGLTCAHGSAACKVSITSKNEYTNEINLGFPENSPTLNKDLRTVFLRYINGSQCPENLAKTISSNFTFICDNNNQGFPVYKHYVNCTYVFEWNTSIACGAVVGDWTAPCTIKDSFLSYEYDLSLLHKKQQIYDVKSRQGKKYAISICGGKKYCNGSAVCHEYNGYGSLGSVIFDYSHNDVKLKYSNGSKCNNNSYTSEVKFICNESVGIGAPKLLFELQCSAEFEWHTEVVCVKHANSKNVSEDEASCNKIMNSSIGLMLQIFATTMMIICAVGVLIFAFLCIRGPIEERPPWSNLINFRRSGRVHYCRVDTTEEARLLLGASDPSQSDSDDDLLSA